AEISGVRFEEPSQRLGQRPLPDYHRPWSRTEQEVVVGRPPWHPPSQQVREQVPDPSLEGLDSPASVRAFAVGSVEEHLFARQARGTARPNRRVRLARCYPHRLIGAQIERSGRLDRGPETAEYLWMERVAWLHAREAAPARAGPRR